MARLSSFVVFVVVAVVIASCGGPAATSPSPAASASAAHATPKPPKDKVTLTGINSTELNLPTLVAIAKDYFGDENLELADFVIGSSGTLRQAMIAKQYDFGLYAFVHVPIARLAGSNFKSIIELHDQEIFGIVVRTQLKDQVKSVKDLKGKKIGFTTPGSGTWALGNVYVKKAGLDPDKDVELVSLGGDNAVFYTALQSGRVDAIISFEPIAERVINDNVGYFLLDIYASGAHRDEIGSDKAAALHLVTREDVIASKPDLVKRMVNVQKKGLDFIRANSASAIADVVMGNATAAAQFQGFDKALVTKVIDHIKSGFGTGCISRAGFDTEMKISTDYKLVSGPITYEQFADTSYAGSC
jgi:NitT/TauT family transport system substrate-binding protein